ncbi:MAG TPA: hypothetical protein VL100_02890 [Croceibacterium sp.]|nr:hypothetical protein [Croceibacterium sp.]
MRDGTDVMHLIRGASDDDVGIGFRPVRCEFGTLLCMSRHRDHQADDNGAARHKSMPALANSRFANVVTHLPSPQHRRFSRQITPGVHYLQSIANRIP